MYMHFFLCIITDALLLFLLFKIMLFYAPYYQEHFGQIL